MTKFTNIFTKIISAFLGVLIVFNISTIVVNQNISYSLTKSHNINFPNIITYILIALGGILMIVGIMALFKLINKLSNKGLTLLAIVLIGVYSLFSIVNVFVFPTIPNSDSFYVQEQAIKMAKGETNIIDGNSLYFGKYSNNNAMVILYYYLYKAFLFVGANNLLVVGRVFNALCVVSSVVLFYFAIKKFTENKVIATKFLLLSVMLPSVAFSSSWVYTATICLPFIGGIFLCGANLIKAISRKSIIINSAIIGVLSIVGYKIRPVTVFISLAGFICMFFWTFKDKKRLAKSLLALATCAVVSVTSFVCCKSIDNHYYTGSEKQFPLTHWISMSLKGNGTYNLDYTNYHQQMNSTEEINKDSIKNIEESLNNYNPWTLFLHQYKKSSIMWSEGNLGYYTRQQGGNKYQEFHDYICGPKKQVLLMYCQILWLCFHLLILVYLYRLFKGKSSKKDLLLAITLLGAFVFYMIWEVKINYALPFASIIIAMATMGGVSIENKLIAPKANIKKYEKIAYISVASVFVALLISNIYFVCFNNVKADNKKLENLSSVSTKIENVSYDNKVVQQTFYNYSCFNNVTFYSIPHLENRYSKYNITLKNSKNKIIAKNIYSNYYSFEQEESVVLKLPKAYNPKGNEKFTLTVEGMGRTDDFLDFNYSDSSQIDCLKGGLEIDGKPVNGDLKFSISYNSRILLMSLPGYIVLILIIALIEFLTYIYIFDRKKFKQK